jgi:hypothetical protein
MAVGGLLGPALEKKCVFDLNRCTTVGVKLSFGSSKCLCDDRSVELHGYLFGSPLLLFGTDLLQQLTLFGYGDACHARDRHSVQEVRNVFVGNDPSELLVLYCRCKNAFDLLQGEIRIGFQFRYELMNGREATSGDKIIDKSFLSLIECKRNSVKVNLHEGGQRAVYIQGRLFATPPLFFKERVYCIFVERRVEVSVFTDYVKRLFVRYIAQKNRPVDRVANGAVFFPGGFPIAIRMFAMENSSEVVSMILAREKIPEMSLSARRALARISASTFSVIDLTNT